MSSKTARFRYSGPVSSVTLRQDEGDRDITLSPGETYELPADHPHVQRLLARAHLDRLPEADSGKKRTGGKTGGSKGAQGDAQATAEGS